MGRVGVFEAVNMHGSGVYGWSSENLGLIRLAYISSIASMSTDLVIVIVLRSCILLYLSDKNPRSGASLIGNPLHITAYQKSMREKAQRWVKTGINVCIGK